MGNATRWAGEDQVKSAEIVARADRHLEVGPPTAALDDRPVVADHPELARVAQPPSRGIETRAQLQPNGRRVCREILDRHARRPVSLDPPYRGGRYPQRPGDVRLPQASGQPSLAKVEAVLGDQASSGEPRLVDASETICHAPI